MWIVRDSNDMRLSPFFVAIFVASVTFGLSKSANAQVSENSVDTDLIFVLINSKTQLAELLVNKQFTVNAPTTEKVENQTENSQAVVLAKSTETKSEPLVNKQFTISVPTT
ncbi:MAG: hypothetical protein O4808_03805, partial [Trichodesmium sp. St17_bin3_1_1]|nr:hypothetical protein [Trichodesmium sp. St17_bin3_1_1]